jgi:hypothetical protein
MPCGLADAPSFNDTSTTRPSTYGNVSTSHRMATTCRQVPMWVVREGNARCDVDGELKCKLPCVSLFLF